MSSLFDEKRAVERGLNAPCLPGNKWEPIAIDWFLRWKLYADADDDRKESDLYPGPIDNSALKGKYEDELKPGLVDKDNIVLMPCSVTNVLFAKYGGGPRFSREVVNNGSIILPHYQVSLYRVRVDAYLCDTDNPHPDVTNHQRHLVRFFAKKTTYKEVVDSLMRDFGLSIYTTAVRCWLREHDDALTSMSAGSVLESTDDTTDAESSKTSPTAEISGDTKRARIGRILTTELTDKDGPWTYQRHTPQQSIQEILGNDESVHVIIEAARSRKPEDHDWPRASLLRKWKGELRVGDVVDCKDVGFGKWYNAVVKEVTPTGNVSVHYKGWAPKFDEVIPSHLVNLHIQPLYSHTIDRREWAVGDGVDFRVSPADCTAVWLHSKVVAVDETNDRVQVEYSYKEKMDAFKKYNVPVAALSPAQVSSPAAAAVLDDDMVKRQQQAVASLCSPTSPAQTSVNGITTPIASEATANHSLTTPLKGGGGSIHTISGTHPFPPSPPADGLCREWCELLGEDICPEHTHTKVVKPVVPLTPVSFPGQANYLGSGTSSALTTSIGSTISNSLLSRNSPSSYQYKYTPYEEKHIKGHTEVAGAVGLQNLGNTCFMNSILQCVSNTEILTKLFQSEDYKTQLNHDNPLGHGGKLAKAYAKLIQDMWCGAYSKIIPREFKTTIGEFQPQFAGYDQQDSQEFLGFLLDGLHEDLNRVIKKPHVSKIESKGRPDTVIASESWRRYLLRNDSAVVDSCFGQLKSHVTCTNCGNESVTFDEYSSLSLPLPVKNTKCIRMVVQLLPLGSVPVRLDLEVEVTATMSQLQGLLVDRLQQQGYLLNDTSISDTGSSEHSGVVDSEVGARNKSTLHNAHGSCVSMSQPDTADSAVEAETAHSPCSTTSTSMIVEDGHTETADSVEGGEAAYELVTHPTSAMTAAADVIVTMQDTEHNGFVTVYTDTTCAVDNHDHNSMSVSVSPTPACTDTSTSNSSRTSPALFINTTTAAITATSTFTATTNATQSHTTTSAPPSAPPSADSFHFHFGIPYFTKPASIDKSYNAAENANTAITSFVARNDILMAFQLTHKTPEFRKHYSTVSTYSSRPATVYNAADSDCSYVAVDVCMGNKIKAYTYLSSEKIELAGYPVRLALPVDCTNRYVHNKVRQIAQRYLREEVNTPDTPNSPTTPSMDITTNAIDSDSATGVASTDLTMPYSLIVTNVYGSMVRRAVPVDDNVFEVPKAGLDMLVVAWPDRFAEVMDEEQLTAVHSLEGDRSNPATPKKAGLSVYQCFDKYIEREQLAEAETLYCARCQQHLAPIKKMDLWAAPDVLVLQLKRFQYVPGQYFVHREKINNLVDFPIEGLDLRKYVIGPQNDAAPPVYDLYAVSHHSGGLGGGHYTATCKNFLNNKWYDFNDSSVSSTSPERAISSTAYVLFYKRRTGSLKWAGIEPSSVPMPDE